MIYTILQRLAGLAFSIYFRKIYILDADHLPASGPVLLACNHPAAFLEGSILAVCLKRPLHFLTRGDFFINRPVRWFLRQTHQIPIYRAKDGFAGLRSNTATFGKCYEQLALGRVIMIFPEARTMSVKKVRPLQRGAARIAFGTLDEHGDVYPLLLPVGASFVDAERPRRDCMFRFGRPIDIRDYEELYQEDQQAALRDVTQELESRLRSLVLHLESPEKEKVFDILAAMTDRVPAGFPTVSQAGETFDRLKSMADRINSLKHAEFLEFEARVRDLLKLLRMKAISIYMLSDPYSVKYWVELLLSLPVLLAGSIIGFLPGVLTQMLVNLIREKPFKGAVKATAGFVIHGLYYLLIAIFLAVIFGVLGAIAGVLIAMIGYFTLIQGERLQWTSRLRWRFAPRAWKKQVLARRESILEHMDTLMGDIVKTPE